MSVEDLIRRSQLKSEEKLTDQRSSRFKLCIAVNFKSLQKQIYPKLCMPFGTVTTKLKFVHVVERKMQLNFRDKMPFVDSTKSLIFDLTKIAQTFSSYMQFDCKGYVLSDTSYKIEIRPSNNCPGGWSGLELTDILAED